MIALAIAGGGIALMFVALLLVRAAEQRCADARVDATNKAGQLAIAASDIATWKAKAETETRRGDALDKVLDEVATSGDAAGARSRVLSAWARDGRADPAAGGSEPAVPVVEPAAPSDLLKPGE